MGPWTGYPSTPPLFPMGRTSKLFPGQKVCLQAAITGQMPPTEEPTTSSTEPLQNLVIPVEQQANVSSQREPKSDQRISAVETWGGTF